MAKTTVTPYIRWMIRRDLDSVLGIEKDSFPDPWNEKQIITMLRLKNSIGMVAEVPTEGGIVAGYMLYSLYPKRIDVQRLAVDPIARRHRIGTALIEKLATKLSAVRRNRIEVRMCEREPIGSMKFLAACGFRVSKIERDPFGESDDWIFTRKHMALEIA